MPIAANIRSIEERIARAAVRAGRAPAAVTLVGITKGVAAPSIREAFEAGLRQFGENRVQEAAGKIAFLKDLECAWHLVGHLQTNKAKEAATLFDVIHSIDSVAVGEALDRRALRPVGTLLQVNVSGEATKGGFAPKDVSAALAALSHLKHLQVRGLMTVAPAAADPEAVRPVFRSLRDLAHNLGLADLSMGMTSDFEVAVEEGATMVRVGTGIFGHRREKT